MEEEIIDFIKKYFCKNYFRAENVEKFVESLQGAYVLMLRDEGSLDKRKFYAKTLFTTLSRSLENFIKVNSLPVSQDSGDLCYWRFVEAYYPGYSHCNAIALSDDLQCLIDNEISSEYKEELFAEYNNDTRDSQLLLDHYQVEVQIMISAIEGYNRQFRLKEAS